MRKGKKLIEKEEMEEIKKNQMVCIEYRSSEIEKARAMRAELWLAYTRDSRVGSEVVLEAGTEQKPEEG